MVIINILTQLERHVRALVDLQTIRELANVVQVFFTDLLLQVVRSGAVLHVLIEDTVIRQTYNNNALCVLQT